MLSVTHGFLKPCVFSRILLLPKSSGLPILRLITVSEGNWRHLGSLLLGEVVFIAKESEVFAV